MGFGNYAEFGLTVSGRIGRIADVRRHRESMTATNSIVAILGPTCERPLRRTPDVPIDLIELIAVAYVSGILSAVQCLEDKGQGRRQPGARSLVEFA
jgi:hypothetical protein